MHRLAQDRTGLAARCARRFNKNRNIGNHFDAKRFGFDRALESALNGFPLTGAGRTYLRVRRGQRGQLCGAFPGGGSADGSPFSPVDRHVFRSMLMLVFVV